MRDHEFRRAGRPRDLLPSDVPPGRNIQDRAASTYRNVPSDLLIGQDGVAAQPTRPAARVNDAMLLYAIQRRGNFQQLNFNYTATPQLVLPMSDRLYFIIQNLHATANLYVRFGADVGSGLLGRGFKIFPNGGYYEPPVCPQEDVWIAGDAAGTCVIAYANAPRP